MKRILPTAAVLGLILGFGPGSPATARAQDVQAALSAHPDNYSGGCPTTIQFRGRIKVTNPSIHKVQYRFIRSDGALAPVHTLNFSGPGSKKVENSWQLGKSYRGWQAVEVLYPRAVRSGRAAFRIRCGRGIAQVVPDLQIAAQVKEDCVSFDPATTTVAKRKGNWKVVDGSHWLFDFGSKRKEARQTLRIIKHYKMDRSCFVGRPDPSFQYMLVPDGAPEGSMRREDCVSFNPGAIAVKKISGSWKIVDGSHWIFDFGSKKNEANQAYAIIKKYGFTRSCFVGRPQASFEYLRK